MDVIVEGKINQEEGIDEVLQTIINLKTVPEPVLRINCLDNRFQGKIGFSQGGYILGGKIDETGETGYAAVRRLLLVRNGNYAVLDPERQLVQDVNQSLWIDAEKIIYLLPDLPEIADSLLPATPPSIATTTLVAAEQAKELAPMARRPTEKATVSGVNSKARQFVVESWRFRYATIFMWVVILLFVGFGLLQYGDRIVPYLQSLIK